MPVEDGFIDAVAAAFNGTQRLQEALDGREVHLVQVEFRDGCPHATRGQQKHTAICFEA